MTLLITVFAAVVCTIIWYCSPAARELNSGILCWLYWGASLMWLGDAIFEYMELHEEYFAPAPTDMLNDLFLGFSAVALGMVIWTVYFLIKDPKGVVKTALFKPESKSTVNATIAKKAD